MLFVIHFYLESIYQKRGAYFWKLKKWFVMDDLGVGLATWHPSGEGVVNHLPKNHGRIWDKLSFVHLSEHFCLHCNLLKNLQSSLFVIKLPFSRLDLFQPCFLVSLKYSLASCGSVQRDIETSSSSTASGQIRNWRIQSFDGHDLRIDFIVKY